MSISRRRSLLHIWSVRYVLVAMVSMVIVAFGTLYIAYISNVDKQYEALDQLTAAIAQEAETRGGTLPAGLELYDYLMAVSSGFGIDHFRPLFYMLDAEGQIVQQFPAAIPREAADIAASLANELTGEAKILRYDLDAEGGRRTYLAALRPFKTTDPSIGYIIYLTPLAHVLEPLTQMRFVRLMGTLSMIIFGWSVLYLLARRLLKPIREVVRAARQIVAGDYDVKLDMQLHEPRAKEIHELMSSFAEMAERLRRLESLRSQLLAGVTHELNTPLASIRGLVQAVKDKVVSDEEASVFLDHSLKQMNRLQKMVDDLLEFNSFASQKVMMNQELIDLEVLLRGIINRWQFSCQPDSGITIELAAERRNWQVLSDPGRIEQIIVNLLNNARDEMRSGGHINIELTDEGDRIQIMVSDEGSGISEELQADLFEPFYRGANKQHRISGLGLGLPFSRLIARALGGDLKLLQHRPSATFALLLPRQTR